MAPRAVQRIAAEADCDPRTVRAYLDGRPTRARTTERIERAIVALRDSGDLAPAEVGA